MLMCVSSVCSSSSSTASSSVPGATASCRVSTSVCPVLAAPATQLNALLNSAAQICDIQRRCGSPVDTVVHHQLDRTAADTQQPDVSSSSYQEFPVACQKYQSSGIPVTSARIPQSSFADTQQPEVSSSSCQEFPVARQEYHTSGHAVTSAGIPQSSLPPSCPSAFSSVGKAQSQLSNTSAVTSSMSQSYNAAACEPAAIAAAPSISHVCI